MILAIILTLITITVITIIARWNRSTKFFEKKITILLAGMLIGSGLTYAMSWFNHDCTPVEQCITVPKIPTKERIDPSVVKKGTQSQKPLSKGKSSDKIQKPQEKTEPRCRTDPAILNDS